MAITAKVNMVLHGDGSTHILKEDAFSPFSKYSDVRLRPCNENQRSITRSLYRPDMCETFDLVVSNPPFGVTLASETRAKIGVTFNLPPTTPSEGLFIERCFQLLKPGGRLAIIVPESLLNGKELINVRLFLYRMFKMESDCIHASKPVHRYPHQDKHLVCTKEIATGDRGMGQEVANRHPKDRSMCERSKKIPQQEFLQGSYCAGSC